MSSTPEISYTAPSRAKKLFSINHFGVLLLSVTVLLSLWQVWSVEHHATAGGKHTIRIAHWQLELGYRQALQALIGRYNQDKAEQFAKGEIDHPVEVVQLPVTEKVYTQLIYTHLIAGTAPDIIEMGWSQAFQGTNKAEYMLPLSDIVQTPNPYNASARLPVDLPADLRQTLPKMKWKNTFVDGMLGGWDSDLQAQYGIPTCFQAFGRLSYNLDLLEQATGSRQVPETLGELLATCRKLRELGKRTGHDLIPIAGSQYSAYFWSGLITPFSAGWQPLLDTDRNGIVTALEGYAGWSGKRISFTDPSQIAFADAVQAISQQFPSGFTAMDRDAAMFLFVQGKAGVLFTGSWDAATVYSLAKFPVEIAKLPLPAPGEPWGDPPRLPATEADNRAAGCFAINKRSPAIGDAIDFMQYLTGFAENERFNHEADWVPCIIGSHASERMKAFQPALEGMLTASGWSPANGDTEGGQVGSTYRGQIASLLVNESDSATLAKKMDEVWNDPLYGEQRFWGRAIDDARTNTRSFERTIAVQATLPLLAPGNEGATNAYRALVTSQANKLNGAGVRILFNETAGLLGKKFPESSP